MKSGLRSSQDNARSARKAERRRYEAPRLQRYGSVGKLTATGGSTQVDFVILRRTRMPCL